MQDFPPLVADLDPAHAPVVDGGSRRTRRTERVVFADPDLRSPARFLRWLLRQQTPVLVASALTSVGEWLPGAVGPYVIGRIIDQGLLPRDLDVVVRGALVMFALSVLALTAGVVNHTLVVRGWLIGMYGPSKMVARKVAQLGHIITQRVPAGEVLSVSASDSDEFGGVTEVVARFCGALVAFGVIVALVLSTSVQLGLVVLVAAPLVVLLATPLLRPLQRREEVERGRSSELTSMATDIVAGLRILRGIGGEQTFARNYATQSQRTRTAGIRAGIFQGLVDSTSVLASGVFLLILTWLGARAVVDGRLSVGELVSFFGYAVFMVYPIQTFFDLAQRWVRALVSARKAIAVLELSPPWRGPAVPLQLPVDAELRDERSGFVARPGELTIVVSARPDDSAALADRLGRYLPGDHEPVSLDATTGLRGRAARRLRAQQEHERRRLATRADDLSEQAWGVRLGSVDLGDVPISDVRRHIVVSDSSSQLFAGTLQTVVDPYERLTREQAETVLRVAAAEDVFEAVQGGWQGVVDERGRGLSGGQRQRVVLARVLGLDPEVLVLVEPTSAVDAHTEAMIAGRLAEHRRGRTTVVATTSPLLLHHADRIALLDGDQVVAYGTHDELLHTHAGYRRVVLRGEDDDHD